MDQKHNLVRERLELLAKELIQFWRTKGVDHEFGGFHGTLDRQGAAKEPTDKGLIQQARHLWTFSMWYERREQSAEIRAIADSSYRFLVEHFLDPKDGEYVFRVSRDGKKIVDGKKQLYAESFVIFALAEYGRVFGSAEAKERALKCFRSIDARSHDAVALGYDQSHDPGWLAPGAQKDTNTHIHLLEAFTALYRATEDGTVRSRLDELATVVATKLLQPQGYVHKEFYKDWRPHAAPACSYGHDLETAWLLMDAAEALGLEESALLREAAVRMGRNAALTGFDEQFGGYFEEGPPGAAPAKISKVWWVQAEALAGLWRLYQLTGEELYWERLEKTLTFIETQQRDAEFGEWYWEVNPGGGVGPHGTNKGEEWKASYHGTRALVFLSDWIAQRR